MRNVEGLSKQCNHVDATIRNIDDAAYRALKAWAAEQGVPLGEAVTRLVHQHIGAGGNRTRRPPPVFDFGPGSERLSEEVDEALYG